MDYYICSFFDRTNDPREHCTRIDCPSDKNFFQEMLPENGFLNVDGSRLLSVFLIGTILPLYVVGKRIFLLPRVLFFCKSILSSEQRICAYETNQRRIIYYEAASLGKLFQVSFTFNSLFQKFIVVEF